MNLAQARAFVREHGVVLVSAKGPVPTLVDAIAGAPVKGSWWSHPEGKKIFAILQAIGDDDDVLTCRLVAGKVTLVHRRLWPALVAASAHFTAGQLASVRQRHTSSGKHVNIETPFPDWVPAAVKHEADTMHAEVALSALGLPSTT
jgi:hypothetical protein